MQMYNEILKLDASVCSCIDEVSELDICCKSLLDLYLNNVDLIDCNTAVKVQGVIDYMYEQINIGNWKEVRVFLRKTITIASYLCLLSYLKFSNETLYEQIKQSFKLIDFGIMFGCPLDKKPTLLQDCASCLNSFNVQGTSSLNFPVENSKTIAKNYNCASINIVNCPSMESFLTNYVLPSQPVILDNCMIHWPALKKWQDQNYLIKLAGLRTVSIEVGKAYTDSEWTQKLMTVEEFIRNHIYQTNGSTGYLAQYQLFTQIPELKNDIIEPEYCCFSETSEPVDIMAWFGPKGTVSPLHHDPKRNLLAQVVGEKQIFLFSPRESEYLYPHEHELLNNTARVDPRQPDFKTYPLYKNATPYYCLLKPGQMLYIPPKWWHFVESLSVSFSVSFWWE